MYTTSHPQNVQTIQELVTWVEGELRLIAQELQLLDLLQIKVLHVEPKRPRNGIIVYADGTDWNPGGGEGFYGREAGAWVKL